MTQLITRIPCGRSIAEAAIEYEVARRVARELEDRRNAVRCEQEDNGNGDDAFNGRCTPCWKRWESGIEDVRRPPESEWCAACRQRQRLHEAYRKAMTTRGARMRVLQRFALKAIDPRTIERTVRAMEQEHEGATEQDAPDDTTATSQADGHADPDPGDVNQTAPTPEGD